MENANTILLIGRDYPSVDTKLLDQLAISIANRDWNTAKKIIQQNSPAIAFEKRISTSRILDSTMRRLYGDAAVNALYTNTERTMAKYKSLSVEDRIKKYRFEATWLRTHKKYATWEEAAEIYEREALRLEETVRFNEAVAKARKLENDLDGWIPSKILSGNETIYDTRLIEYRTKQLDNLSSTISAVKKDVEFALSTDSTILKRYAHTIKDGFKKEGDKYQYTDTYKDLQKKIDIYQRWQRHRTTYTRETLSKLKQRIGASLPATLEQLDTAINNYQDFDTDFVANRDDIEQVMRQIFADNDLGMDISGTLLESVFNNGFYNTFQSGTSGGYNGSTLTTGPIPVGHFRLRAAHKLFGLGKDLANDQLPREAYEKYGHLLDRDKLDSWRHNRTHYGHGPAQVQVRFKRNRVTCTWTFSDSLGCRYQPSLVSDPKVESFDRDLSFRDRPQPSDSKKLWEWQKDKGTYYIELQFHGDLTIDDVESIVFGGSPENVIKKSLIAKLQAKGIKLYYFDGTKISIN